MPLPSPLFPGTEEVSPSGNLHPSPQQDRRATGKLADSLAWAPLCHMLLLSNVRCGEGVF